MKFLIDLIVFFNSQFSFYNSYSAALFIAGYDKLSDYIGIFVIEFGNTVETTPVDILIGILTNEIEGGIDPELFTKNVGTLSTDILTIRYISMR